MRDRERERERERERARERRDGEDRERKELKGGIKGVAYTTRYRSVTGWSNFQIYNSSTESDVIIWAHMTRLRMKN